MIVVAQALLIASLGWSAFAFGAVYPWAYWPLVAACVAVAALSLAAPGESPRVLTPALAAALLLVAVATTLQLVPLRLDTVAALSPETVHALDQLNPAVAAHAVSRHAITLDPARTILGLSLFSVDALLLVGSSRLFSLTGARSCVQALTVIGVVLALVGIVQQPLYAGKIYGFWQPIDGGDPFGPFVNKNHFAGWMLMVLPQTLGLLCGRMARGFAGVKPSWRDRLLWLSSSDASRIVLTAAAAVVMALALVLTMSRSGITAFVLSIAITGAFVVWKQRGLGRGLTLAYLGVLVALVIGWAGASAIATRFSEANWDEINGRRGAWSDAAAIAARFPLTGSGLDTYGLTTLLYQRHDLERHYNEAHNDYLQMAAEGGVLLTVPAAICVLLFVVAVRRRFKAETSTTAYWLRVGAVTGILAIGLQETVDFSLQMPGNAAVFVVLCSIALHRAQAPSRSQSRRPTRPAAY